MNWRDERLWIISGSAATALFIAIWMFFHRMPEGYIDITLHLKNLNQTISPAAVSCPDLAYPPDTTQICLIEGPGISSPVTVVIGKDGLSFDNSALVEPLIEKSRRIYETSA